MLATILRISLPICIGLLLFTGCGDDDGNGGTTPNNFDRAAMLEHYADFVIRPAYEKLQSDYGAFTAELSNLQSNLNVANLTSAQNRWQTAFLSWQDANAFNFGPAGEAGLTKDLVEEIGTFPVSREKMENLIAAGDTSLNNFDRDTRGFLAIEYLLFGNGESPEAVVTELQGSNRMAYLRAVGNHLGEQIERVLSEWQGYRSEFVAADGTDVGSSTSLLYNSFVRSYESIKNFKVGLPAGKRPGQTQTEPELVEAFYSGLSLPAIQAHLAAIERIYYGTGEEESPGFYEYLQTVEGGPELIASTEAQWANVLAALADVPTDQPFYQLVADEHPSVDNLHTELQKHTRFFKSDMSSLLGIAITFSSGDGD